MGVGIDTRRAVVYVAGPLTGGSLDWQENVRAAIDAGDALVAAGYAPWIPHLASTWHLVSAKPWGTWIDLCLTWVERCDVVLRLPGVSPGADVECRHAEARGIPVCSSLAEIAALELREVDPGRVALEAVSKLAVRVGRLENEMAAQ